MKNIYIAITAFVFLISTSNINAQQQNRFWYFGNNIGLDFGPGLDNPIPINGIGNFTDEGSGVISDASGNFLFYTDGQQAINNQENIITMDLSGDRSSTQSSIVVPSPGNCNEIYIFSVDFGGGNDGLGFNVVNTQDWSVSVSTNICDNCFEKVTSIPHSNGEDHWIISIRPNSRRVPVYLLSENGVSLINDQELTFLPATSNISYGSIKGSHDGTKLAIAYGGGGPNRVELLSFNPATGNIVSHLNTFNINTAYGLEFSPSSGYLFVSGIGSSNPSSSVHGSLSRYESEFPYALVDETTLNHNSSQYEGGALQLGPDDKIYMARDESEWLDVINTPDDPNDWGYQEQAIVFDCTDCVDLGLPNLVGAPNVCDPCDISNSLIPNPGFEDLANGQEPSSSGDLSNAATWAQATRATSDYFSLNGYSTRIAISNDTMEMPAMLNPESRRWVGGWRSPNSDLVSEDEEYIEYVGAELLSTLEATTTYTLKLKVGAPRAQTELPPALIGDIVVLGLPDNTSFPISGFECKQNVYPEIGRTSVNISAFSWQEVTISIEADQDHQFIMFGLACDTDPYFENIYFLVDDLLLIQGEDPCPSECFSITADSPPCNADIETENQSTYTYDFTFRNETEETFSQILLFDEDESFNIDEGTLLELGTTLSPGQSVDLSWDIDAMSSFSEETVTYCFEIAPYNHSGACCKAQHCVELTNCCEVLTPAKSVIEADAESCCYNFGYETCVSDYFVSVEIEMMTEGLTLEGMMLQDGYSVTQMSESVIVVTVDGGNFFPIGDFSEVLQFCVGGMTSMSPEEQEIAITWKALTGTITAIYEPEICPLSCLPPEDDCAEIINPIIYCDELGVYHYQFSVRNINERMLDASILVLGPEGSTTAGDFSHQTFPEFPGHDPISPPYLAWQQATGVLDITLPNAVLGSSYEFILSLHDYRNIDPVTGEYWCCYTPLKFTIDITELCGIGSTTEESAVEYYIYPNPSENLFTVRFKKPIEYPSELKMVDIHGVVKNRFQLPAGVQAHSIGITELNTGMYFISVQDDEGNEHSERFLKK